MGRPAYLTYEAVAAVCDQLVSEGIEPSAKKVHDRLGGKGGMGKAQELVVEWRAQRPRPAGIEIAVPTPVIQALSTAMRDVAEQASATAETRELATVRERDELTEALKTAEEALADAIERADAAEAAKVAAVAAQAAKEEEVTRLSDQLTLAQQLAADAAQGRAERETKLEQQTIALTNAANRIERLETAVEEAQSKLAKITTDAAVTARALESEQATTADLRTRLQAAESASQALTEKERTAALRVSQLEAEVKALHDQVARADADRERLETRLDTVTNAAATERAVLLKQASDAREQAATASARAESEVAGLRTQIDAANAVISRLEGELAALRVQADSSGAAPGKATKK